MTSEELGQAFVESIKRQEWFARVVSEHGDNPKIAAAAMTGMFGMVIAGRSLERLAVVLGVDLKESYAAAPDRVLVVTNDRVMEQARITAHLIVEAGPDGSFDVAEQPKMVQ